MLKNGALFGVESPSAAIALRAGPLELLFEPKSGRVRRVRLDNRDLVRGIYGAIRDRNWATILPVIKDLLLMQKEPGGFEIRYRTWVVALGIVILA